MTERLKEDGLQINVVILLNMDVVMTTKQSKHLKMENQVAHVLNMSSVVVMSQDSPNLIKNQLMILVVTLLNTDVAKMD